MQSLHTLKKDLRSLLNHFSTGVPLYELQNRFYDIYGYDIRFGSCGSLLSFCIVHNDIFKLHIEQPNMEWVVYPRLSSFEVKPIEELLKLERLHLDAKNEERERIQNLKTLITPRIMNCIFTILIKYTRGVHLTKFGRTFSRTFGFELDPARYQCISLREMFENIRFISILPSNIICLNRQQLEVFQ